ncbi:MAG: hypothetical protein Q8936_23915, partial [Bacillota bacterium]|nr:hypothetical protein [Bacillota bacterium]
MPYAVPKTPVSPNIRLGADGKYSLDGGINLSFQETALPYSQSPYLLNVNADDRGTLKKRQGQTYLDTSLGSGGVNGITVYKNKIIKAWSTFLYSENLDGTSPVQIYSGLANSKAFFFIFNGLLYMLNGTNYIQYDGTTVQNVVPYIPQITISRKPDGSQSTLNEPMNLLTGQFIDSFSSDNTATYKLSFQNLISIDEVKVNGSVVSTGITLNTTAGTVVFTSAPATSSPNNVTIKATVSSNDKMQILNCTIGKEFSSRMFLTGNPNYPNKLWKTGLAGDFSNQANYFPASGLSSFDSVSGVDQAMVNFVQQYDKLIYLKEKSTFITYADVQSDGTTGFPISYLNSNIGCDMPGSVQVINNNPVWCNTYGGLYMMVSTTVLGEKNIIQISANINGLPERPGLLQETLTDLKNCSSFDDGKKYYLCVGSKVYVWDYSL